MAAGRATACAVRPAGVHELTIAPRRSRGAARPAPLRRYGSPPCRNGCRTPGARRRPAPRRKRPVDRGLDAGDRNRNGPGPPASCGCPRKCLPGAWRRRSAPAPRVAPKPLTPPIMDTVPPMRTAATERSSVPCPHFHHDVRSVAVRLAQRFDLPFGRLAVIDQHIRAQFARLFQLAVAGRGDDGRRPAALASCNPRSTRRPCPAAAPSGPPARGRRRTGRSRGHRRAGQVAASSSDRPAGVATSPCSAWTASRPARHRWPRPAPARSWPAWARHRPSPA